MVRRIANLDSAIGYYSKRLATSKRKRDKLSSVEDSSLIDLEIALLEDIISYLKLC